MGIKPFNIGDLVRVVGNNDSAENAPYAQPGALAFVKEMEIDSDDEWRVGVTFLLGDKWDEKDYGAQSYPFYYSLDGQGLRGDNLEVVTDEEI